MRRVLIAVVVVGFMALAGYVAHRARLKMSEGNQVKRGRPEVVVPVEVAQARSATLRDVGLFTGSLVPDSRFVVAPRVAGRLEKLLANLGDPVVRGQSIAVLDDKEYIQQVERAKAELAVARASVQECQSSLLAAQREFERMQALLEKKIASESEYDQAKTQSEVQEARCRVAAATVDQKDAALKEAEIRLSYTKIAAVWEGGADTRFVGERYVDEGALLAANSPILSIIDIDTLTAAVYVIERDYSKIAVGQEAQVTTDAYPDQVFMGRILRIAPQLQETSRQARVEIRIPNPQRLLKPGMFVRVALEFARHEDVATIPSSALVRREGKQGVFVADSQAARAHFVPVELGVASGELVEVVGPALDGPVVVMGQHLLTDGSDIVVTESKPATRPAGGESAGGGGPTGAANAPGARR